MNKKLSEDYLARLSEALVGEIKAEMGRRGVGSSRALGDLISANSQWVSHRLDGGNKRTGERVAITTTDLARIANALDIEPATLVQRAIDAVAPKEFEATVTNLSDRRGTLERPAQADAALEGVEGQDEKIGASEDE